MLVSIPDCSRPRKSREMRKILEDSPGSTARRRPASRPPIAKFNLQIPEGSKPAMEAGDIILRALGRNPMFNSAALPLRVLPPMFNRYDVGMKFDAHVDGSIRAMPRNGMRMRADVSSTLFLIAAGRLRRRRADDLRHLRRPAVKLPAGDMIVYPATSLHRVTPITRGSRWSSFFWTPIDGQGRWTTGAAVRPRRAIRKIRERCPTTIRRWSG